MVLIFSWWHSCIWQSEPTSFSKFSRPYWLWSVLWIKARSYAWYAQNQEHTIQIGVFIWINCWCMPKMSNVHGCPASIVRSLYFFHHLKVFAQSCLASQCLSLLCIANAESVHFLAKRHLDLRCRGTILKLNYVLWISVAMDKGLVWIIWQIQVKICTVQTGTKSCLNFASRCPIGTCLGGA